MFKLGQTKGKENRMVLVAVSVLAGLGARSEARNAADLLFAACGSG